MKLMRQPVVVEAFHYDLNSVEDAETDIRVEINPIDMSEHPDAPKIEGTALGLRIVFQIVFEELALTGAVNQFCTLADRNITKTEDFSQEELDELMRPLFSVIERMTYEVTEIALDRPGIQLNFQNNG